jgi:hypothetical protein
MNGSDDGAGVGLALLGLSLFPLTVLIFVWFIAATVAALIALHRGRSAWGFFFATFFFLGPLGIGVALLAARELNGMPLGPSTTPPQAPNVQKPREVEYGRRRLVCHRCGAESDILKTASSFDCWRCDEHRTVVPKVKPKNKV